MNRLGDPPYVCLVTPGELDSSNFNSKKQEVLRTIAEAIDDGVRLIQLREKSLPTRLLFELATDAVDLASRSGAIVVVNDRLDIAFAAGAGGVHLPGNSIPIQAVREPFGSKLMIGVSTHSIADITAAADAGADYAFFGPVFATQGKPSGVGLAVVGEVSFRVQGFPVFAIGGIDDENCASVIEAGASGVAAIRALNDTESRRRLLRELAKFSGRWVT